VVSDAAYSDLEQKVAAVIAAVDRLNAAPALTTPAMYDNLDGSLREMRDFLHDFRESPRKYMRLKLF